jgi:hypothetical protein
VGELSWFKTRKRTAAAAAAAAADHFGAGSDDVTVDAQGGAGTDEGGGRIVKRIFGSIVMSTPRSCRIFGCEIWQPVGKIKGFGTRE